MLKLKFSSLAPLALALSLPTPALADDHAEDAAAATQIEASINALMQAYTEADADTIGRLLAEPYSHINNGSEPVLRVDYMAWQRSRQQRASAGTPDPMTFEISNVVVTMHNDTTATATGLGLLEGVRNGEPWSLKFRFTNLWLKTDGEWQRAAFHDTYLDQD